MTNKLSKQYNYAEMSVLNVKSIKVTNGENKDNFPLQVSPKGRGELEGSGLVLVWYRSNLPDRNQYQPEFHRNRDRTESGIPVGS